MAQQNTFELLTPYLDIEPQDMEVDALLALPPGHSATSLKAGEWLSYDSSYKGVRAHTVVDPVETIAFAAYFDPGDVSVQSLGQVPVLKAHGGYEVDTLMLQDGVAAFNFAHGGKVIVGQVDVGDGVARSGLIPWDVTLTAARVFGYITKLGTFGALGVPLTPTRVYIIT